MFFCKKNMMKYILIIVITFCLSAYVNAQNTTVKGRIVDERTKNPIPGLSVNIQTTEVKTDEYGKFEISVVNGEYILTISSDEWSSYTSEIKASGSEVDLGDITLKSKATPSVEAAGVAEISLSDADVDNDKSGQNISGLLHSSNDAFTSAASYNLSAARFNVRGYNGENILVFMNGLPMNDPENGRASYSEWGGLNNVTRNKESQQGLAPSLFSLGTIGGETNINICASQIRKQNNISYAFANRSYNHRIMYTYSTGMQENGWAFVLSGSKRWAEKGNIPGTWYDAYAYFLGAEKKFSDKHSLAINFLGSPYKRAMQAGATKEAYELAGTNYYNSNWGYQTGEIRNSRVRNAHQPSLILTDNFKISDKSKLTTSLGYSFGRFGTTKLNWYNSRDPRPDYYRYLPSYTDNDPNASQDVVDFITEQWSSNSSVNQIDWDNLYQINYLSNLEGESARYILEEQRKDNKQLSFHTILNHELTEKIVLTGGLLVLSSNTHHFKVMNDLLGANYWVDVDQFAERDYPDNPILLENDLNNPGRIIKVGDKFGYDYNMHSIKEQLWGLGQYKGNKIEFNFGLQISNNSYYRDGNMKNGRYPTNSFGKSETLNFFNYLTKAGITYKISGRNYLVLNGVYYTQSPLPENSFVTARISNEVLANLENETNMGTELSYIHKGEKINARITLYETSINNQTDLKSYYLDLGTNNTYVNLVLQNIDKIHQGIEFGTDIKITKEFTAIGALNLGNYLFTSRQIATRSYENGLLPDTSFTIYSKYFFVPTGPQNAASIGLKYNNSKYWFASVNFNYFDKSYLDFNSERRTEGQLSELNLGPDDPIIDIITKQERLESGYTVDLSIGKSWRIDNYYIGLNFNINNLLNNQNLVTGGYEQLRTATTVAELNKFPSKYYYGYRRSYFLMLSFRF